MDEASSPQLQQRAWFEQLSRASEAAAADALSHEVTALYLLDPPLASQSVRRALLASKASRRYRRGEMGVDAQAVLALLEQRGRGDGRKAVGTEDGRARDAELAAMMRAWSSQQKSAARAVQRLQREREEAGERLRQQQAEIERHAKQMEQQRLQHQQQVQQMQAQLAKQQQQLQQQLQQMQMMQQQQQQQQQAAAPSWAHPPQQPQQQLPPNGKRNPFMLASALSGGGARQGGDDDNENEDTMNYPRQTPQVSGLKRSMYQKPQPAAKRANATGDGGKKDDAKASLPPELQQYDPALVERIECDIVHTGAPVRFEDIAGLDFAKKCVMELICWPMSRPDIFTGLRALPKGLLLFGPPGTGKTLIGKAIAHQCGATFFSISASSLTSKWIGEGEQLVRTLFAVAAYRQPSVVFIDEVDSLLSARKEDDNESSRRIKTEFLVQLDGAGTNASDQVVIVGATNRPEELDEAARRRFVKRIYIPLPDVDARTDLIQRLLGKNRHRLSEADIRQLVERTRGYSGADIRALCTEAAMGPIRELSNQRAGDISTVQEEDVPPISREHFDEALRFVTSSVSGSDLERYVIWNRQFGTFRDAADVDLAAQS